MMELSIVKATDDEVLQDYIDGSDANFHITCSYSQKPVYSNYIDFSNAIQADHIISGTFGAYLGDGNYSL